MKIPFRKKYTISIFNQASLRKVWEIRLHPLYIVLSAIALIAVTGAIWYALFCFTPLNNLFPEKELQLPPTDYDALLQRVDSITKEAEANQHLINTLRVVLGDTALIPQANDTTYRGATIDSMAPLPAAGDAEEAFVRKYRQKSSATNASQEPLQ